VPPYILILRVASPNASPTSREIDFKSQCDKMLLAVKLLADLELAAIVDTVERAHSLGPFVDPTAYRDALYRGDMDTIRDLADALLRPVEIFNERVAPLLPQEPDGG
jgi:hypothetical protein